jgi:hypothetical protein
MGVIYQFVFELNQARFFPALEALVGAAAPPDLPGVLLVGVATGLGDAIAFEVDGGWPWMSPS